MTNWLLGGILFSLVVISWQINEVDKKLNKPCEPPKPDEAKSIEIVLDNVSAEQKK